MKLIALMSWYDESPIWLAATIASLAKAGVDHIVAVDGAYFLFPDGAGSSGVDQHIAIVEAANASSMGVTIHVPTDKWQGNEVEKRSYLFKLGEQFAEPDDWYFVMDADQVVMDPFDLKPLLEETDLDVAHVTFLERQDPYESPEAARLALTHGWQPKSRSYVRCLFRAIPGLRVVGNHYTYKTPDGRYLWGNSTGVELEEALDLRTLEIEHRANVRTKYRKGLKHTYYNRRNEMKAEVTHCYRCDQPSAYEFIPISWREHHDEDGSLMGLVASYAEVCEGHIAEVMAESRAEVESYGYDADTIEVNFGGYKRKLADFQGMKVGA